MGELLIAWLADMEQEAARRRLRAEEAYRLLDDKNTNLAREAKGIVRACNRMLEFCQGEVERNRRGEVEAW